jgi:hypothetical protein
MEKNMIVLQNDVKSLTYKTVPYKETSLKIGGGSLTVYNPSDSTMLGQPTLTISDCGSTTLVNSFQPGELLYESISAQTDISIENGAVILRPRIGQGSTMLAEPRWFYDGTTNTMVISLIQITSDTLISREGIGTVRMKLGDPIPPVETQVVGGSIGTFCLDYSAPAASQNYQIAWDKYINTNLLNSPISISCSGTPGSGTPLTYTLTNNDPRNLRLVIKKSLVKIEAV